MFSPDFAREGMADPSGVNKRKDRVGVRGGAGGGGITDKKKHGDGQLCLYFWLFFF